MPVNREATSIGHGTEWIHLDSIADLGLSRCTREHIHLVDISNSERREVAMTNLKRPAEILATIDAATAREDRMKFYNANNGIIVSRGFSGSIPFRFATSIVDIRTGWEVYDKEGDPQWVFQAPSASKKEEENEEPTKSSSKEVANISTPEDKSDRDAHSPRKSASSKPPQTSKGSYAPERTFDTTEGNSATTYARPKSGQSIRSKWAANDERPTSRESIKTVQPITAPVQHERGRFLAARPRSKENRKKSQNTVHISPSRPSSRKEQKSADKRKKSRNGRESSNDASKEQKRTPLVYSSLEYQRQKQLGLPLGQSIPEPSDKRATESARTSASASNGSWIVCDSQDLKQAFRKLRLSPAQSRSNSESITGKRGRSDREHSLPPRRFSSATDKNTYDSRYFGGDTRPIHPGARSSCKSDIVIDTSRTQHDGRLNVSPATDSPREPKVFNTQPPSMKRNTFTESIKLDPVRLPVAIDSNDPRLAKEAEEEPHKKRVDEDWRNQRHVFEKSIDGKRHILRVEELAKEGGSYFPQVCRSTEGREGQREDCEWEDRETLLGGNPPKGREGEEAHSITASRAGTWAFYGHEVDG